MRTILVIGIGMGHPDQVTVQAMDAMRRVDVFFVVDKATNRAPDGEADALVRARVELCERHLVEGSYRIVTVEDPPRQRAGNHYRDAVESWHAARAERFERAIADELGPDGCGGILVWGDPSLYDSTLRILDLVADRGGAQFAVEVVPGISSVQVLA